MHGRPRALQLGARLPAEVETALYRIVQEALTNIVKHAQASASASSLHAADGRTSPPSSRTTAAASRPAERSEGLGLVGMRERVALLGGRLTIESTAGAGTTLVAEVPVP